MSEKYKNPDKDTTESIIKCIKEAETHDDVIKIINSIFPNWIIGCSKKYSADYPHFTKNWESVCNKIKCKPLDIVIIDEFVFYNKEYSLIQMFCEVLTLFGHSVRRKEEFFECKYCSNILPTEPIYNKLRNAKIAVPPYWSMKCKSC
jgi:hypothetical protein